MTLFLTSISVSLRLRTLLGSNPFLFRSSHCSLLVGKPSKTQPYFWQSLRVTLFWISSTIISLVKVFPLWRTWSISFTLRSWCSGVKSSIRLLTLIITSPNFLLMFSAKVVFPDFGGPMMETLGTTLMSPGHGRQLSKTVGFLITLSLCSSESKW